MREPRVTLGGRSLVFPVTLEPGQYLEAFSAEDCALYRMSGERIGRVQPRGEWPDLDAGPNAIELVSAPRAGEPASRLRATVFAEGA